MNASGPAVTTKQSCCTLYMAIVMEAGGVLGAWCLGSLSPWENVALPQASGFELIPSLEQPLAAHSVLGLVPFFNDPVLLCPYFMKADITSSICNPTIR